MKPTSWDADALASFAPSVAANPFGPLASNYEVLKGAHLFEYTRGRQHALVAGRLVTLSGGHRLDIVGLVSDGDRLDAREFDLALVHAARGLDAKLMALTTQVPHVARSCMRQGWGISGTVMLKIIERH